MTRTLVLALLAAAPLAAQQPTPDFRWEKAIPAGQLIRVHNLNGDVAVSPSTSGKVEVTGVRRGSGRSRDDVTVQVVEVAGGLVICAMFRDADMECDEDGMRTRNRRRHRDDDWDDARIDITVRMPKGLEVRAGTVSGDVSVTGAEGHVRASSVSGDVRLESPNATSVRASSVSGDVEVRLHRLDGTGSIDVTSVSGDVELFLPKGLDADISMRSVSGSMESDFPLQLNGSVSRNRLEARIGRGGRSLDVHTVSGDVRLRELR